MMNNEVRAAQALDCVRINGTEVLQGDDCLVVEEPLEIRINGRRFTATMRTPGDDELLARGLLFSEGVIEDDADIISIEQSTRCREHSGELVNIVNVTLERD